MEDKVLHEVRIVETEDGFRIEIKGDKEQIREFLKHRGFGLGMGMPGMGMPPGPMGFMRRHHREGRHEHGHHGRHRGPFGHFAKMWTSGPWDWDEQEEEEQSQKRGPEADKGSDAPRV